MMAILLDGKALGLAIRETVKQDVDTILRETGVTPHLAVILVGDDPASQTYVKGKENACRNAGIRSTVIREPADVTESKLLSDIDALNADPNVHGILLQLPIPKHLDPDRIIPKIDVRKDVDGFTPENVAALANGRPRLVPCTPRGVMRVLDHYGIAVAGKDCVVVGRSQIVGKPMAALLLNGNGTVTVCHSKTRDLRAETRRADILVVAIGKTRMIDASYIKPGAVVIDVGISKVDGVIAGDVDFDSARTVAGWITPVPGGIGPMTIACLLENTLVCCCSLIGGPHD
ncbi:MAG: tetrahydrofolate dehydrogenase/cyclohydrolase catalytic domain-containing protein [Bacillota bacterium]|nr:tetrahydrofolate dehydrogenase/cyclohydrolase catalytic domain-containing protein [Bacillota bacterium]